MALPHSLHLNLQNKRRATDFTNRSAKYSGLLSPPQSPTSSGQLSFQLDDLSFGHQCYTNLDIVSGKVRYNISGSQPEEIKSIQVRLLGVANAGKKNTLGVLCKEKTELINKKYTAFPTRVDQSTESPAATDPPNVETKPPNAPAGTFLTLHKGVHEFPFVLIFPDNDDPLQIIKPPLFNKHAGKRHSTEPGNTAMTSEKSSNLSARTTWNSSDLGDVSDITSTCSSLGPLSKYSTSCESHSHNSSFYGAGKQKKSFSLPPSFDFVAPDGTYAKIEYFVVVTIEKRVSLVRNKELTTSQKIQFVPRNGNLTLPEDFVSSTKNVTIAPSKTPTSAKSTSQVPLFGPVQTSLKSNDSSKYRRILPDYTIIPVDMKFNITRKGQVRNTAKERNNKIAMALLPLAKVRHELHLYFSNVPFVFQCDYYRNFTNLYITRDLPGPTCRVVKPNLLLADVMRLRIITSSVWLKYLANKTSTEKIILLWLKVSLVAKTLITHNMFLHEEEQEVQVLFNDERLNYPVSVSDFQLMTDAAEEVGEKFAKGSPHEFALPSEIFKNCYFTEQSQSFMCNNVKRNYFLKMTMGVRSFSGDVTEFRCNSPVLYLNNEL